VAGLAILGQGRTVVAVIADAVGTADSKNISGAVEEAVAGGVAAQAVGEVDAGVAGGVAGLTLLLHRVVPEEDIAFALVVGGICDAVAGGVALCALVGVDAFGAGVGAGQAEFLVVVVVPLLAGATSRGDYPEGRRVATRAGGRCAHAGQAGVQTGQTSLVREQVVEVTIHAPAEVIGVD
jgi:hypothetical protein